MKRCRWCQKEIDDDAATVCPHAGCRRPLDPAEAMRRTIPRPPTPTPLTPPSPPPPKTAFDAPPTAVSGPPVPPPDAELSRRLKGLQQAVSHGRLRSLLLALGAVVLLLIGMAALGTYYVTSVFSYAEVDPEITIRRDPLDANRLLLVYRPTTRGTVAFRRVSADRDTELLDLARPTADGQSQTLQWRGAGLEPGDPIWVTSRRGLRLVHNELRVPERPPLLLASIYAKRTLANRQQWITRYGGNAASEKAVNDGLRWLARHQADNGSWSNRCLGHGPESKCDRSSPCGGTGGPYDMALTGLALLAFQAGGHYAFNGNNYSDAVRKGLDWMVAQQRPDGGLLRPGTPTAGTFYQQYMYEHGMATFALAEACAVANVSGGPAQDSYRQAMDKAVRFIYRMQHDDGGWRYSDDLRAPSDTSVAGWQVLALKSAKEAGVAIDPKCIEKIRVFFANHAMGENGRTGYQGHSISTEATTGVGMLARQFLLNEPDGPLVRDAARYLAGYAERTWPNRILRRRDRDYYLWYNCALAMFQAGGEPWRRWNRVVRDTLTELQEHGGCEDGSWGPDARWGSEGGRIYATALAALTLEVYYRYAGQDDDDEPSVVTASSAAAAPETPASAWVGQGRGAAAAVKVNPNVPSSDR